ncbi:MAG: MFS transporter [Vicingaceae bacterium]
MRQFIRSSGHLLAFGFLLTFLSSFGQTFLISLYVPELQNYFQLSDGLFSSFYSVATLASAFTLSWLGRFIDKVRLHRFLLAVFMGLCFALLLLSQAYYLPLLFLGLYALRLFGQGLMTHTSIASMARFFDKNRGKAISIASLGHPAGEAILPTLIVALIGWMGWRYSLLSSMVFVLSVLPLALYLLTFHKKVATLKLMLPQIPEKEEDRKAAKPINIIKSKFFWMIAPCNFAAASIGTAILFFQLKLGENKSWSAEWIAASFVAYAIGGALSTILAGWLTDRFRAKNIFFFYLIPFIVGLIALTLSDNQWVYPILVAGIGITNGYGGTVKNAAIAEIYGTKIIGSVRSLYTTVMVFSTAIGPIVFGVFLDAGISFNQLAFASIGFMLLMTLNAMRLLRVD